ncbi:hypothetical protein FB451DRAFT_1492027 [Mycena latifolia]|nr:hypothetical protein FB451DRAFT_1492027 [Mycena latifolia]
MQIGVTDDNVVKQFKSEASLELTGTARATFISAEIYHWGMGLNGFQLKLCQTSMKTRMRTDRKIQRALLRSGCYDVPPHVIRCTFGRGQVIMRAIGSIRFAKQCCFDKNRPRCDIFRDNLDVRLNSGGCPILSDFVRRTLADPEPGRAEPNNTSGVAVPHFTFDAYPPLVALLTSRIIFSHGSASSLPPRLCGIGSPRNHLL